MLECPFCHTTVDPSSNHSCPNCHTNLELAMRPAPLRLVQTLPNWSRASRFRFLLGLYAIALLGLSVTAGGVAYGPSFREVVSGTLGIIFFGGLIMLVSKPIGSIMLVLFGLGTVFTRSRRITIGMISAYTITLMYLVGTTYYFLFHCTPDCP